MSETRTAEAARTETKAAPETRTADAKTADAKTTDAKAEDARKTDDGKVEYKLPDDLKGQDGAPDVTKVIGRLSALEAERNARGLPPESPEKYEFKAPENLKMPDGTAAEIDADSAIFKQFRELSFELGLPQEKAQKLFELGVEREFELLAQIQQQRADDAAAEKVKLGSKHDDRLNAVGNWLKSHFGKEGDEFFDTLGLASQIQLFEKMIAKFGGAGASGASSAASGGVNKPDDLGRLYPTMAKR